MKVEHLHDEKGGRFFIQEPDESVTELIYRTAGLHKMIIEHTEVSEKEEGKGLGKTMVAAAADYARQHEMKILPVCAFAKAVMERDTAYHDLLVENQ